MKWLTLQLIKQQARIDETFTLEDTLLTLYGETAEDTVLQCINRTYTDVMEKYGEVPRPIVMASLMLAALSYKYREPITTQNLYLVPYSFDLMVKPFIRLADDNIKNNTDHECI